MTDIRIQSGSDRPVSDPRRPVLVIFWTAVGLLLAVQAFSLDLGGQLGTLAATVIFLFGGLPHGAYDISLLGRVSQGDTRRLVVATAVYIAIVVAMILAWRLMPAATLVFFLIAAAWHFGEDWELIDDAAQRLICGASIAAAPAIAHPEAVSRIFSDMTGGQGGAQVATALFLLAPVIVIIAAVSAVIIWQRGDRSGGLALGGALASLLIFPPVVGFALYFVCLHSPRHLASANMRLGGMALHWRLATAFGLPIIAGVIWWLVNSVIGGAITVDATAQAFQLLAALTIPHLVISGHIDRHCPR